MLVAPCDVRWTRWAQAEIRNKLERCSKIHLSDLWSFLRNLDRLYCISTHNAENITMMIIYSLHFYHFSNDRGRVTDGWVVCRPLGICKVSFLPIKLDQKLFVLYILCDSATCSSEKNKTPLICQHLSAANEITLLSSPKLFQREVK